MKILSISLTPLLYSLSNPWLNDFIAEWEQEKTELEKQGKRSVDFKVNEPYASDVSEGKNNPIYNAHSYHTKVPHPAIMRYILHYTQPGDIVFDGFVVLEWQVLQLSYVARKRMYWPWMKKMQKWGTSCCLFRPISNCIINRCNLQSKVWPNNFWT